MIVCFPERSDESFYKLTPYRPFSAYHKEPGYKIDEFRAVDELKVSILMKAGDDSLFKSPIDLVAKRGEDVIHHVEKKARGKFICRRSP